MSALFSDYAKTKLLDLYKDHPNEVGSVLRQSDPTKYATYKATDCITYVLNVLAYAFEQSGDHTTSRSVWSYGKKPSDGKFYGSLLAQKLISHHHWVGIYINPDVVHPRDAANEHNFSHYVVNNKCHYYQIPVKYKVVNYSPTSTTHVSYQQLVPGKGKTKLNAIDITTLQKLKFGFGLSRGGMHTWVYSEGYIYEVHWDQIGSGLYEKTKLEDFPWLSGVIIVPPDAYKGIALSPLSCAAP